MPGEINTGSGSVRSEYPLGVGQKPANTMKHIDSESKKRDVSEPKPPQANAETDRLMRAHVFSANQSKEKLAYADKRAFSEKFIEIYFEDEEKKSLINSVKTMSNTEFEFFWKTLLDYLAKESNGKLYMAPILKEDGLTKGSRIGPRYFIKVYKNGKVRLKFISKEKSEEILKEKGYFFILLSFFRKKSTAGMDRIPKKQTNKETTVKPSKTQDNTVSNKCKQPI
jgi:hypothetical protein